MELLRLLVTLAAYPLVVVASRLALGLRRAAPGEVDALGHRL
jgi:rod shape-determining protein MreD